LRLKEYLKKLTPQEYEGKTLTCLPSSYDPRDFKYNKLLTHINYMETTPVVIDYRPNLPPVFDQKDRGSCVACATAWTPKAFAEINEGCFPADGLSASFLYSMCKSMDGTPEEEGTNLKVAMQVLQQYGICPEEIMPYSTLTNLESPNVPIVSELAKLQAKQYKISTYAQLCSTTDVGRSGLLTTIRQALKREGPFIMALLVCSNFAPDPITNKLPLPQGFIQGGHAIGIVGDLPEIKCLIMRNSWGSDWGIDGYAYLPYEWLTSYVNIDDLGIMYHIFEAWVATDIITPKMANKIEITPNENVMLVDGIEISLDQPAFITDKGRTVMPVRSLATNMGYLVGWQNGKVILTRPS